VRDLVSYHVTEKRNRFPQKYAATCVRNYVCIWNKTRSAIAEIARVFLVNPDHGMVENPILDARFSASVVTTLWRYTNLFIIIIIIITLGTTTILKHRQTVWYKSYLDVFEQFRRGSLTSATDGRTDGRNCDSNSGVDTLDARQKTYYG